MSRVLWTEDKTKLSKSQIFALIVFTATVCLLLQSAAGPTAIIPRGKVRTDWNSTYESV